MLLTLGRPFICATLLPFFPSLTARSRGGSGLRAFAGQPVGAAHGKREPVYQFHSLSVSRLAPDTARVRN